ncbi:unnamed protein product [Symbiodinium natans]|uniref:Uncharacterized protein n=1 Tax=Symbiodinium natans TaxID=878477 RepID=A0A812I923_9DINO|nr:unnamed protein product [Symbiodinium natans]CAE7025544.1 unnamed protein product [Symbiodinium natans]
MGGSQSAQAGHPGPEDPQGHISTPNGPIPMSEFKRLKHLHRQDPSRYPDPKVSLGLRDTSYISVNGHLQTRQRDQHDQNDQAPAGSLRPENLHAAEGELQDGASWSSSWHYGLFGQTSRFDVHDASQRGQGSS